MRQTSQGSYKQEIKGGDEIRDKPNRWPELVTQQSTEIQQLFSTLGLSILHICTRLKQNVAVYMFRKFVTQLNKAQTKNTLDH